MPFSSPVATAEFSKFAGILSAALSQHHLSGFGIVRKSKSKPRRHIISHLPEWPSSKGEEITNVGNDMNERQSSYTVGGTINWYSHYGKR